jgi:hypothetical protein
MHHDMSGHQTDNLRLSEIKEQLYNVIQTLDNYIGEMRAAQAAAQSIYFSFFFLEGGFTLDDWRNFQKSASNMDRIEYRSGQFYFMDTENQQAMPIVSCKVTDSIGGDPWRVTFQVHNPATNVITHKTGVMSEHEFKELCIFVISKSNSTDFLGDFIANGVKPSLYSVR